MRSRQNMTDRASMGGRKPYLSIIGLAALVVALAPPLSSWSERYAVFEAVQYSLLAIVVPALLVLGAPWPLVGLGSFAGGVAKQRRRHATLPRAAGVVVPAIVVLVLWRTPVLVDHLARDRWLMVAEACTLVPAGTAIWLECVASPPFFPRIPAYARIAVAAITMWTIWVLSYLVGLSNTDAYAAYAVPTHRLLSRAADDQLAAGVTWLVAGCAFVPIVFANLMAWLRNDSAPSPAMIDRAGPVDT
ncbi:MAG: cytochrome c oxidase assembly protein [Acidimicrobiales bacterium]